MGYRGEWLTWRVAWVSYSYRAGVHYCPFCGVGLPHTLWQAVRAARDKRSGVKFVTLREAYDRQWRDYENEKDHGAYEPETWPEEWFCDALAEHRITEALRQPTLIGA